MRLPGLDVIFGLAAPMARVSRNPDQIRRLLALAEIYDGSSRSDAARIGGVSGCRSCVTGCCGSTPRVSRWPRERQGAGRSQPSPKLKKRTALVRALKEVFRRHRSQPIERVINLINPVLRGWVNYFAVGHSSECFSFIKDWVEKKVRRHLAHAQKRKGFGWKRWNRRWLYDTLRLFNGYRVRRDMLKVAPAG
jgi:RNA-directed DNA polymerase